MRSSLQGACGEAQAKGVRFAAASLGSRHARGAHRIPRTGDERQAQEADLWVTHPPPSFIPLKRPSPKGRFSLWSGPFRLVAHGVGVRRRSSLIREGRVAPPQGHTALRRVPGARGPHIGRRGSNRTERRRPRTWRWMLRRILIVLTALLAVSAAVGPWAAGAAGVGSAPPTGDFVASDHCPTRSTRSAASCASAPSARSSAAISRPRYETAASSSRSVRPRRPARRATPARRRRTSTSSSSGRRPTGSS